MRVIAALMMACLIGSGMGQYGQDVYGQNVMQWNLGSYEVAVHGNVSDVINPFKLGTSREGEYCPAYESRVVVDEISYSLILSEDTKPLAKESTSEHFDAKLRIDGYPGTIKFLDVDSPGFFPSAYIVVSLSEMAELKVLVTEWGPYHGEEGMNNFKSKVVRTLGNMTISPRMEEIPSVLFK